MGRMSIDVLVLVRERNEGWGEDSSEDGVDGGRWFMSYKEEL